MLPECSVCGNHSDRWRAGQYYCGDCMPFTADMVMGNPYNTMSEKFSKMCDDSPELAEPWEHYDGRMSFEV